MTQFYKEYTKVFVAVDCIIFGFDGKNLQVLIGIRKMDPGRDEWSLYGGFVGQHESLEEAANRVILDLTGMKNLFIRQVGAFGNIDRAPGERVISVAYCTLINVVDYDDKLREQHGLEWVSLKDLPPTLLRPQPDDTRCHQPDTPTHQYRTFEFQTSAQSVYPHPTATCFRGGDGRRD